jgi:Phage integrase family
MSNNAVLAALRRMGYAKDEMTGHGFRSMASTLLHEQGWNHHAIERQLAHAERNAVSAAYNSSIGWWRRLIFGGNLSCLRNLADPGNLPRSVEDRRRLLLRPVHPQHQDEAFRRCGKPIGFLPRSG